MADPNGRGAAGRGADKDGFLRAQFLNFLAQEFEQAWIIRAPPIDTLKIAPLEIVPKEYATIAERIGQVEKFINRHHEHLRLAGEGDDQGSWVLAAFDEHRLGGELELVDARATQEPCRT